MTATTRDIPHEVVVSSPRPRRRPPPATIRIARVALAALALHIADDSFFQPQPGTSPGDHLVSGLVPLAVLAVVAWRLPRMRAGARAAVLLLLVPLAIALGAEALYYWRETGLSGDDYSGLLALPSALALLAVTAHTLWTSRRLDDRRSWRFPRRALLTAAAVLGL